MCSASFLCFGSKYKRICERKRENRKMKKMEKWIARMDSFMKEMGEEYNKLVETFSSQYMISGACIQNKICILRKKIL